MIDDRIGILIADDHRGVRQTLNVVMEVYDDIQVLGEAANGHEAVALCEQLQPDVVLMDLVMPGMDGAVATQIIRHQFPRVQVLVLTSGFEPELIRQALNAGAQGYLEKNVSNDVIADAIRGAVSA